MAFLNILQKYKLDFRFRKTNFGISMGFEIEIEFCFWRLCFLNAENAKIFFNSFSFFKFAEAFHLTKTTKIMACSTLCSICHSDRSGAK
ncbi:MAG TPA: hypothetical protein DIW37_03275 [Chryseobacterium sp.]|nr:hypothetical protein [Chryseobacterium sp.]